MSELSVAEVMTSEVESIRPDATVMAAYTRMVDGGFRHLPVTEGGVLLGIISDRDLLERMPPPDADPALHGRTMRLAVSEVMTANPVTVRPGDALVDAIDALVAARFGALLVTEGGRLVGVLSLIDVAARYAQLLRAG